MAIQKNWTASDAYDFLDGSTIRSFPGLAHTHIVRAYDKVSVRYHDTHVLTWNDDSTITLRVGTYEKVEWRGGRKFVHPPAPAYTNTTKQRINQFQRRVYVYQEKRQWWVRVKATGEVLPFRDGMTI